MDLKIEDDTWNHLYNHLYGHDTPDPFSLFDFSC
jgi:hypothetical protein